MITMKCLSLGNLVSHISVLCFLPCKYSFACNPYITHLIKVGHTLWCLKSSYSPYYSYYLYLPIFLILPVFTHIYHPSYQSYQGWAHPVVSHVLCMGGDQQRSSRVRGALKRNFWRSLGFCPKDHQPRYLARKLWPTRTHRRVTHDITAYKTIISIL